MSVRFLPGIKLSERFPIYLSLTLLFSISIFYYYRIGNYIFSYQENRSLFFFSGDYFQKFIIKPGGFLEYSGNFLTQGHYNPIYGSLILSVLLILQCVVFYKINRILSSGRSYSLLLILIPSSLFLLMQKQPDLFIFFNIGFLLTSLYFLFSIGPRKWQYRIMILTLFPIFFYLAGSFILIFVGMYLIYCITYEKGFFRILLPVLLIVSFILVFIIFKEFLFLQPIDLLLNYPMAVIDHSRLPQGSYLLSVYFILFPFLIKTSILDKAVTSVMTFKTITILTVFPITVFLLLSYRNLDVSNLIHIEESVNKQDWDEIIKLHECSPSGSLTEQYFYNIALSEKGELCNRLFTGRQDSGAKSLSLPHNNQYINKSFYFYYTIGIISEAHHLAYESMVVNGYNPENIKMLIKTELIVKNYRIASKYINILKKTFHYRIWAEKYEKMLYDTTLINSDPELSRKKSLIPDRDFFVRKDDIQNIELLLIADPYNKRAFEYKMAHLLIEKDIKSVVSEVNKMKEIGYDLIPRHIEEAVTEFINLTKESPDLGGLIVSHETKLRYKEYLKDYDLYKNGNKLWSEKDMKNAWGNTFWYYFQFN